MGERCDALRLLADHKVCTPADKANIAAVIHDYEQGMTIPQPGNGVLYFSGKKMTKEISLSEVSLKDKIDEWSKIYGPGDGITVESAQHKRFQYAATTTFPALGPTRHHMVRITVLFFPYRLHITNS